MTDVKPTPYSWPDPKTIPTRAEEIRNLNLRIKWQEVEIASLRDALNDVLVYSPDYMHGMPRKHYEKIARGRA